MMRNQVIIGVLTFAIILAGVWFLMPQKNATSLESESSFNDILSAKNEDFARVLRPRGFIFPQDYGPHEEYRTEWWYFTGNLSSAAGRKFGYELTFFRFALTPEQAVPTSSWRHNQMYMAHLTLTDVESQRFYTDERFSRAGNGLAGASAKNYHVWLHDWKAKACNSPDWGICLDAKNNNVGLSLQLVPQKKMALQGVDGFSQKSPEVGNASYYYSYTRMATHGNIKINQDSFAVKGSSWMDREWSSSALAKDQAGWDWFALQLSDASELMFYRFRRKDGHPDTNSSGAIFNADDSKIPLAFSDVSIKVLDYWSSPHSNITYPSKWQLSIPNQGLELVVSPLINDQELNVTYRYWEGAVSIKGKKNSQPVSGKGYIELTGYQ